MKLSVKQTIALDYLQDSKTKYVMYGGAAGGGKSHLAAYYALKTCLKYPGVIGGIGRKVLKELKQTILESIFEVAEEQGVRHLFKYDKQMSELVFNNGSKIYLIELMKKPSDPKFERLGSRKFTFFIFEEAGEIDERAFDIVSKTRLRHLTAETYGIGKILLTANPTKNFLKRVFFDKWQRNELADNAVYIQAFATDNIFLSKDYLEGMQELEGIDRERLLLGNWNYADGDLDLVGWDDIQDIFSNTPARNGRYYLTADIATYGVDKFVIMLWDGWNIEKVWEFPKSDGKMIVSKMREIKSRHRVTSSRIVYDGDGVGSMLGGWLVNSFRFQNNGNPLKDTRQFFDSKRKRFEYENLKTQCAYKLAEMIKAGEMTCTAKGVKRIIEQELQHLQRTKVDKDYKLYIKSKDDIKESLGRSPDYLDNLIMRAVFEIKRR